MENNKKILWIGLVIILLIIAGLMFWSMQKVAVPSFSNNGGQVTESTEDTSEGSLNVGTAGMSYQSALAKYNGAVLALDESCKAKPNNFTLINNGSLMVDNTSSLDRVVKAGSTFNLKAHGFKIVKLVSQGPSATLSVDCDQNKNVASIMVQ